jgi:hypothetical protein
MGKIKERDPEKAIRVKRTAELAGVSERQVYRVIDGDQKNEEVLRIYMQLSEGENLLIEAIKKAVPIES